MAGIVGIHKLIAEEYVSATEQGLLDIELEGKSIGEIIRLRRERLGGRPGVQIILEELAQEIERSASRLNYHLPSKVYAGLFPTLSFNAQVQLTANGALILIYTELFAFIVSCVKVYVLGRRIHLSEPGKYNPYKILEPAISHSQVVDILARIVDAYFSKGSSLMASRMPTQGAARASIINDLTDSILRFAIAHEYGHVLAGHLKSNRQIFAALPSGKIKLVLKSWEQEIAADQYGFDLCVAPIWPAFGTIEKEQELASRLQGPFGFFSLAALIEAAANKRSGLVSEYPTWTDHPPPRRRAENMKGWLDHLSDGRIDTIIKWLDFSRWIDEKVEDVCIHMDEIRQDRH